MNDIEQIKEKLDIVEIIRSYIPLQQAGKNFKAVCPFHKEKTPSFIVSPDRQTWHCFGQCNEGGDVISFVMKYENVEFYDALRALAGKAGIELRQLNPAQEKEFGMLYDICEAATKFFEEQLLQSPDAALYLTQRGIRKETREEFSIGYAPHQKDALMVHLVNAGYTTANIERSGLAFKTERGTYMDRFRGRVMFPLKNTFGKTVSFSGRILPSYENEHTGKYVNGPETGIFSKSRLLFALDIAKSEIKKADSAIIVEGQMDLVTLFQEGVRNVVATSGTALTQNHLVIIKKLTDQIVLAFDSDEAGQLAAERALDMAHMLDFTVRLFFVPDGKDASEYIAKNPGKIGATLDHTQKTPFDFYYTRFFTKQFTHDVKRATRAFLQKTLILASPIDQVMWLQQLATKTQIPERVLHAELELLKKNKQKHIAGEHRATTHEHKPTSRREMIADHIIMQCSIRPELVAEVDTYKVYLPARVLSILQAIQGAKDVLSSEQKQELAFFSMKASLEKEADEETALYAIRDLLRELKKEYIQEKIRAVHAQMKTAHEQGNATEERRLLQELDEIVKLKDNG